jgi:hypothetical protein
MPAEPARLNHLTLQKQLLIAESNLNRAQLVRDLEVLVADVRTLGDCTSAYATVLTTTKTLVAVLEAFHPGKPAAAEGKASWWQSLHSGISMITTLWRTFRPSKTTP